MRSVYVRANGPVNSAVTDGTNWYLGGSFSAVNAYEAPHVAVLNASDGSPALGCDLQVGFDGAVLTLVTDNSSIHVGGQFSHYRGHATPGGLVRIDATTCQIITTYFLSTDQVTQTTALALSGSSLFVASDGRLYQGASIAATTGLSLIKVDVATTARTAAFVPNFPVPALTRLLATSGALYAGLFKLDLTTGNYDPAFVLPLNTTVQAYALSGNTLYVGGLFSDSVVQELRKFDATTGVPDASFDAAVSFDAVVYDLALSGNALYVAGDFQHKGSQARPGVVKLDATTGALDATFAPPGNWSVSAGGIRALQLLNGSLYVAGNFIVSGGRAAMRIAKLDATTGALDSTFTQPTGLNALASTMCMVGNVLYVGGQFQAYRGTPASNLAKLNVLTGVADAAFTGSHGTDGPISSLALQGTSLYLAGAFQSYNGIAAQNLAKVNAVTAAADSAFMQAGGGTNQPIVQVVADASAAYIGGGFAVYRGAFDYRFAKLNATDGSLDSAYSPAVTSNLGVEGNFSLVGPYVYASSSNYPNGLNSSLIRFNAQTGQPDSGFLAGVGLAGQQELNFAFTGTSGYATVSRFPPNSTNPSSLLKFDTATGAPDSGFYVDQAQLPTPIYALVSVGGSLYAAASPVPISNIGYGLFLAKLDGNSGAPDTIFSQPSVTVNGPIRVLATTGTDLWAGGDFTQYRGGRGNYFIPINPQTGASADP